MNPRRTAAAPSLYAYLKDIMSILQQAFFSQCLLIKIVSQGFRIYSEA